MKKTVLLSAIIFLPGLKTKAQIGINTNSPTSTLDIVAKNATGNSTTIDGLLLPRVDRQRAKSMTSIPTSTLIYVNDISTGPQSGTTANMDTVGYYYFDGSVWVKLISTTNSTFGSNIYNSDGTLTGSRTVTQGSNPLTFTTTATNGFSVDGNTFSIDAANNRMGLGTIIPRGKLEIVSDNVGDTAENDLYFNGYGSSAYPSIFLGSSRGTAASPTNLVNGDPIGGYYFSPRINGGFGNTLASGILSIYKGDGTNNLTDLIFRTSGGDRAIINENGNFGIGTSTPQKQLHVNGALQVTNELNVGGNASTAGSAGTAGQILTSNGSGTPPSWQTINAISGTVYSAHYVQGTSALTIPQGTTADVPGATITLTVPPGRTQTFLFSVLGYAIRSTATAGQATQGVFSLIQNGVKISSAYVSSGDGGTLVNLPVPVSFLKATTLSSGTYIFKIRYSAWFGNQIVNHLPSNYGGYDGDTEAMLTKIQVLVYNN